MDKILLDYDLDVTNAMKGFPVTEKDSWFYVRMSNDKTTILFEGTEVTFYEMIGEILINPETREKAMIGLVGLLVRNPTLLVELNRTVRNTNNILIDD